LLALSPFYETEPVDYTDQEWFLNAVLKIRTGLAPLELMFKTQAVQKLVGRKPGGVRFGPRILDLDIIFYDDQVILSPQLTIPHKRMHKRRFVLQPICDIDPHIVHPVLRQKVKYLLDQLEDGGQDIKLCLSGC
jgi:2-amino-4-hydroxy-6-hydroxymethyldihydropteridine diphosphokinase